jgi:putative hydroxymethylpyrimidine transport system substrate-binding protein
MPLRSALAPLAAALALAGLAGCAEKQDDLAPPAQRPVTVLLDGAPSANHAGLLTAEATGEFAKGGLGVTLRPTTGPDAALADLVAGRADLALTSQPAILRARDDGAPALSVAAIVQEPLASLTSIEGEPVAPQRLRGRRVGTAGTPYADAVLDELLQSSGVDPAAVRRVDLGDDLVQPLVRGRVDVSLGPFWNTDGVRLRLQDRRPRLLPVDRAGLKPYDEVVLVARGETVQRDGALVRRFLQALQRGTRAARADPGLAVRALREADPQLPERVARASVRETLPVLFPPQATRPVGWQDYQEWQDFADWMLRSDLLTRPLDAGDALTNEFLPGQGVGTSGSGPAAG